MNAHVSYDIDELVAAITPDNVHDEVATGDAVGNEDGCRP
jgi:antitoxin component of MazEF toxin-antitoxin module